LSYLNGVVRDATTKTIPETLAGDGNTCHAFRLELSCWGIREGESAATSVPMATNGSASANNIVEDLVAETLENFEAAGIEDEG
jgi:hypothetical protein